MSADITSIAKSLFPFLLTGIMFGAEAQALVVPEGGTHVIAADQSFSHITVNGTLVINAGAEVTTTGELVIQRGGTVSLSHDSNLTVEGEMRVEETGLLFTTGRAGIRVNQLTLNSGRMIVNSSSNVEVEGNSDWLGNAELSVNENSFFRVNGSLLTQGSVTFLMSATSELAINGPAVFENVDNIKFKYGRLAFSGGSDQIIKAPKIEADNLVLYGASLRLLTRDTVRIHNLTLYRGIMHSDQPVKILSSESSAIQRSIGYIVAPSLTRAIALRETYIFPIGTASISSAVQIAPLGNLHSNVTVEFVNGAAANLSERPVQIISSNSSFYHKIYKQGELSEVDMAIYYPSSLSGSLNRIMNYMEPENKWGLLSSYSSNLNMAPDLNGASGRQVNLVDYRMGDGVNANHFVLAQTEEAIKTSTSYAVLKKKLDGGYVLVPDGILRFQFEEEYPQDNDDLDWRVFDANHVAKRSSVSYPAVYGDNRYELDIRNLISAGFGVLEVSNNKNEKWYLRFKRGDL